jgi:hypothetical protein
MALNPAREAVEKAALHLRSLYTEPALNAAAALLADLYAAGVKHGISSLDWDAVTSLPDACLSVTRYQDSIPKTSANAVTLLDQLVDAFRVKGIDARRDVLNVLVPRHARSPKWGPAGTLSLAVTLNIDHGWGFVLAPARTSPVISVIGPHDVAGAEAVAELAWQIVTSVRPNPFRSRW